MDHSATRQQGRRLLCGHRPAADHEARPTFDEEVHRILLGKHHSYRGGSIAPYYWTDASSEMAAPASPAPMRRCW